MNLSDALSWAAESIEWLVPVLLVVGLICVAATRTVPRSVAWGGFGGTLAIIGLVVSRRFAGQPQDAVQLIAWSSALVSLICSVVAAVARSNTRADDPGDVVVTRFASAARLGALLLGVGAAVIQVVVLVLRMLYVVADLVNVFPAPRPEQFGFAPSGLWTFVFLFAASLIGWWSSGERSLFVCLVWLVVAMATWLCALPEIFQVSPQHGLQATGATLLWMTSLAMTCALAVVVSEFIILWRRKSVPLTGDPVLRWPGLRVTCASLAVVVILLAAHQLAVPVAVVSLGFRATMAVVIVSVMLTGFSCLMLVVRDGTGPLTDAAFALFSLAFCAIAVLFVPGHLTTMAERYPAMFTAQVIGLAAATAFWAWLGGAWQLHSQAGSLNHGLVAHAKRAAFLDSLFGLIIATMLALWPRLPSISVSDDTLASLAWGVVANLALLLAVLWSGRRLRRLTFYIITLMLLTSLAGFVAIRVLPFASHLQ